MERVRALAGRRGASVAQLAIASLLAKPIVSAVLIGASKPTQLDDNLGAVNVRLSLEEVEELEAATAPPATYPKWFIATLVDPQLSEVRK